MFGMMWKIYDEIDYDVRLTRQEGNGLKFMIKLP